jgi:hypothetical protein
MEEETLEENTEGSYCFFCKERSMILSENGLVYECTECGYWCYSSS